MRGPARLLLVTVAVIAFLLGLIRLSPRLAALIGLDFSAASAVPDQVAVELVREGELKAHRDGTLFRVEQKERLVTDVIARRLALREDVARLREIGDESRAVTGGAPLPAGKGSDVARLGRDLIARVAGRLEDEGRREEAVALVRKLEDELAAWLKSMPPAESP